MSIKKGRGKKQIKILDAKEAKLWSQKTLKFLGDFKKVPWPGSQGDPPCFVLGESTYSNRKKIRRSVKRVQKMNTSLRSEFEPLYELVREKLEQAVGGRFVFRRDASLPGFHILLSHRDFQQTGGNWHFDFDYEMLTWKKHPDPNDCISFTLALELPSSGAQLHFADRDYEDYLKYKETGFDPGPPKKIEKWEHRQGYMIIQRGPWLHRIAPISRRAKWPFMRVTLQGMAVKQGKTWQIFW